MSQGIIIKQKILYKMNVYKVITTKDVNFSEENTRTANSAYEAACQILTEVYNITDHDKYITLLADGRYNSTCIEVHKISE